MSTLRMTSDLRRQLILSAAKRCFARNGFAGTTTKSVAAAAAISEGLLFKHFPSKAALYAEILAEECEADPDFANAARRRVVALQSGDPETRSVWRQLFEIIPDENFGLNFDPSHLVWQFIDIERAIREFAPRVSVLLNVTADHLDRYPPMDEYAEAKYRIFANQRARDAFVGNADDEFCARLRAGARSIPSAQHWFNARGDASAEMSLHAGAIVRRAGKQRRRRAKDFGHDMRVFEGDAEGNEVPPADLRTTEERKPKPAKQQAQVKKGGRVVREPPQPPRFRSAMTD